MEASDLLGWRIRRRKITREADNLLLSDEYIRITIHNHGRLLADEKYILIYYDPYHHNHGRFVNFTSLLIYIF